MQMHGRQQATVATLSVLETGGCVDFINISTFGEEKPSDHCGEWNCYCLLVYITAYSPY